MQLRKNTNNKIAIINNKQFKTFKNNIYIYIYISLDKFLCINTKATKTKRKKRYKEWMKWKKEGIKNENDLYYQCFCSKCLTNC